MTDTFYRRMSKLVRAAANCAGTPYPITLKDGFEPPELEGEGYHYETRGGRRIWHPSAYAKKGRSNMVYVRSNLTITVGKGWVLEALLAAEISGEAARSLKRQKDAAARAAWEELLKEARGEGAAHARARFTPEGGIAELPNN